MTPRGRVPVFRSWAEPESPRGEATADNQESTCTDGLGRSRGPATPACTAGVAAEGISESIRAFDFGFPGAAQPQPKQRSGGAALGGTRLPASPGLPPSQGFGGQVVGHEVRGREGKSAEGASDDPREAPSATSHAFLNETRSDLSEGKASHAAAAVRRGSCDVA